MRYAISAVLTLTLLTGTTYVSAQEISVAQLQDRDNIQSEIVSDKECVKLEKKYGQNVKADISTFFQKRPLSEMSFEALDLNLNQRLQTNELNSIKMNYLKLSRCRNYIDDVILSLFDAYYTKLTIEEDRESTKVSAISPPMELMSYVTKKVAIERITKRKKSTDPLSPFPIKKFHTELGGHDVSLKERLYALYTPGQIKDMSQIMSFVLKVMDATKVETIVHFRNAPESENYVIDHTASDIYRLALSIFTKERKKLIQANLESRLPFSPMDIIVSSYEMGVLSNAEISVLTSDPTFYRPEVSIFKKIFTYLARLGVTAAQLNPTTAPYALMTLVVYNSYQESHKSKDRIEYENFFFPSQGMK